MIRRHPHVFGEPRRARGSGGSVWAEIKAQEKAEKLSARRAAGLPDHRAKGIWRMCRSPVPALTRAIKLRRSVKGRIRLE